MTVFTAAQSVLLWKKGIAIALALLLPGGTLLGLDLQFPDFLLSFRQR